MSGCKGTKKRGTKTMGVERPGGNREGIGEVGDGVSKRASGQAGTWREGG